jgi:SAM-dependent methyltransferase
LSQTDILKWDAKYAGVSKSCSAEPDAELIKYASLLPQNGCALDLACGTGKNALFLAQQGLDVDAIDGSVEALNRLRVSAQSSGMAQRLQIFQTDLDNYALPESHYDLILVVRYLKQDLLSDLAAALKPGGILVYKTFNRNILKQRPGFNLAYTIETNELIEAFPSIEMIADNRENASSVYAFMIGRKAST